MSITKEAKFQKELKEAKICSICFKKYEGFGNNASPINTGTCCNSCNDLVIIARLNSRQSFKNIKQK